jgi:3',5'-cyclic AMP phosphodiesterase CpdA
MTVLLQISDPHFGTDVAEPIEALVELAHDLAPDLVVVSGDITQRGRRAQFAAARSFVQRLAVPATLVIPGNHDIPLFNILARVAFPYAGFIRAFGRQLSPVWSSDDALVIGVRTTRRWRHKHGEVSNRQIREVAHRLAAAGDRQLRIVVVHQPVHVVTTKDEVNLLRGHADAVAAWSRAGADLVLGGHIHLPYVRPLRERHPELARSVWTAQAGTAVSSRVRGAVPNSVNVIRYDAGVSPASCQVERWDCVPGSGRFAIVESVGFELDRRAVD